MRASTRVTNGAKGVAHSCGNQLRYVQHLCDDVTLFERKCQERLDVIPPDCAPAVSFCPGTTPC